MSVRVVVDMNLSLEWVSLLERAGWPTVHWPEAGDPSIRCCGIAAGSAQ